MQPMTTTYHVKVERKVAESIRKLAKEERRTIHNLLKLVIERGLQSWKQEASQ